MPLWAVGLPGIFCAHSLPAKEIFALRYRLQMLHVNTCPNAAEMVDLHTLWYRADLLFPSRPMR